MEKHGSRSGRFSSEWCSKLEEDLTKNHLAHFAAGALREKSLHGSSEQAMKNREKDHISHFILRLVFCSQEEDRRWLITQELDLFRLV